MKTEKLRQLCNKLIDDVSTECNKNINDYVLASKMSYMVDYTEQFLNHLENYETLRNNNK